MHWLRSWKRIYSRSMHCQVHIERAVMGRHRQAHLRLWSSMSSLKMHSRTWPSARRPCYKRCPKLVMVDKQRVMVIRIPRNEKLRKYTNLSAHDKITLNMGKFILRWVQLIRIQGDKVLTATKSRAHASSSTRSSSTCSSTSSFTNSAMSLIARVTWARCAPSALASLSSCNRPNVPWSPSS